MNVTDTVTYFSHPETAIHSCAFYGHTEIAKFLIDKGLNDSAVDWFDRGALHSLVLGINPKDEMMTLLVEAGADVNAPWGWNTPLQMAATTTRHDRMVQQLLDLGANQNAADWKGLRPVHKAATRPNAARDRCLLEAGKNAEIADHDGRTPLHEAARCGMTENVKVLLEMGANPSSVDSAGSTPLQYALDDFGDEASMHRILHLGASMLDQSRETYTDCILPCQLEQTNPMAVEMLLAAGADIAKLDRYGNGPLGWAVARARGADYPRARLPGR